MRAVFLAMALGASAALTGCASIDQSLFGNSGPAMASNEPSTVPAPETPENGEEAPPPAQPAAAPPESGAEVAPAPAGEMPGTLPPPEGETTVPAPSGEAAVSVTAPPSVGASSAPAIATAPSVSAAPAASLVTIAPGPDTGTSVNHTIAGIRANLQDVASRVAGAAQQLNTLRRSNAQQLTTYYQAQAQISARLQIGTTRANPELVAQWNTAQAALDQLTGNINALNTLAQGITGEVTRARLYLAQIAAAGEAPGAVDEDHRQLAVLEDETNQAIVVLDRLARDATADLRRQTAALGSERARLDQLAGAIKAGDLTAAGTPPRTAAEPAIAATGNGAAPLVTIRFARANTNYQKTLYNALSQALQAQPGASFNVIGVSPTRRSASAVQAAQNDARRHAQDVMRTMTEMGVPATRMALSSATDPAARSSEVRVFLR